MVTGSLDRFFYTERTLTLPPSAGLYGWDVRVKLALVVLAIILNTWVALPWLSALVLLLGLALVLWTRIPARQLLPFLLVPVWPVLLVVVGMALGFGAKPLAHLGPLTIYGDGLLTGAQVALRAYCDVIWLAGCVLTAAFPQLLAALRWYRVPAIAVDTLAMMYRYAFVLYAEFRRMRLAAQSRGGLGGGMAELRTSSRIAAQIFLRAFDRSERIYWAMAARGGERDA